MKILKLQLNTAHLQQQKEFYSNKMNLTLMEETSSSFTLKVGTSQIVFQQSEDDSQPFYHFAFNIPENQFSSAKDWLLLRTEIIGETFFKHWNAHAMYFLDPSKNIVELIARHDLKNQSQTNFSEQDILCVSEIGMPVQKVQKASQYLYKNLQINFWNGSSNSILQKTANTIISTIQNSKFAVLGDQQGLLIMVAEGRTWFPTKFVSKIFPISLTLQDTGGDKNCKLEELYEIRMRKTH